ncbi:VWA domain-containing protein [Alginatibacterium sediminis]|uniref:VWA domain-containing protein n=2 Tax=Alginatibacterium sediminis TaxID=2164068 RepID=A0A420EI90_9ALTE|nr:VWA domain-containing protein [Alginatibacterium sediminis]
MTGLSFELPWLLLLLPAPLLLRLRQTPTNDQIKNFSLLTPEQTLSNAKAKPKVQQYIRWLAWGFFVCAMMRPITIAPQGTNIIDQGRDMMIAVDLSGSMQIKDMQINGDPIDRLQALQVILLDFIKQREGDRLGMILFADHAYLASPLTFDLETLNQQVKEFAHGLVGDSTAIGEAIGLGVAQLLERPAEQRILILLTDGQNTSGTVLPIDAARIAAQNDVQIYAIGVGADEMLSRSLFGVRKVNPSQDLDEALLKEIAELTNGTYFRARSTEDLLNIYQEIDKLNPIEGASREFKPRFEMFWVFILIAGLLEMSLAFPWSRLSFAAFRRQIKHIGGAKP